MRLATIYLIFLGSKRAILDYYVYVQQRQHRRIYGLYILYSCVYVHDHVYISKCNTFSIHIYIYIPLQILTNALQTCPGVNRIAKIQMAPTVAVVSGSMNWLQTENLVQVEI